MDFKLLIALPNSNNFTKYMPTQSIRDEILKLLTQKKKSPDSIEIKLNNITILMLDIVDESKFKTGYIIENGQVIYKLRWLELYPAIDVDKLRIHLLNKTGRQFPDWQLHWIADLQN